MVLVDLKFNLLSLALFTERVVIVIIDDRFDITS